MRIQLIADSYATCCIVEQQFRQIFSTMAMSTWAEFIQPVLCQERLQLQTQTGVCYAILRANQLMQIPFARILRPSEFIFFQGTSVCKFLKTSQ